MLNDPSAYTATPIPGVIRGLVGEDRGRYFIHTPSGLVRLRGRPTPENVEAARKRHGYAHAPADAETVREVITLAVRSAKYRPIAVDRGFDLTIDYVIDLCAQQGYRCALSGIQFMMRSGMVRRNPFAPSIDRLDVSLGYVKGNVRLTCIMANLARADFGDDEFYRMCEAAVDYRKKQLDFGF